LWQILGSDSGWQPIPLTEVITSAAVKKAYRKATLCVHPDKLQQRGASIQQKYICEKVFDLLKVLFCTLLPTTSVIIETRKYALQDHKIILKTTSLVFLLLENSLWYTYGKAFTERSLVLYLDSSH
jgi:hypothetical protein